MNPERSSFLGSGQHDGTGRPRGGQQHWAACETRFDDPLHRHREGCYLDVQDLAFQKVLLVSCMLRAGSRPCLETRLAQATPTLASPSCATRMRLPGALRHGLSARARPCPRRLHAASVTTMLRRRPSLDVRSGPGSAVPALLLNRRWPRRVVCRVRRQRRAAGSRWGVGAARARCRGRHDRTRRGGAGSLQLLPACVLHTNWNRRISPTTTPRMSTSSSLMMIGFIWKLAGRSSIRGPFR